MRLNFDNAWVLYFLWIVPAVVTWWVTLHKRALRAMAAFVSPTLQQRLFPKQNPHRQLWQIGLAGLGLLLLLVAMARPKWGEREETIYQQARDLVIAVDVSRSMLANDVHPTRLRRAKIDLIDLIVELRGDRAALIAFRAKASLVCPLTTDYAFLRQALDGISPASAPRGETDIGAAIEKALGAFDEGESSHKAIILISDGEDLSGKALELAERAGEQRIPIYTVGLGSRQGSRIPNKDRQTRYIRHKDQDVVTKLDHETLYAIAKASGGSYIPVETASMTSTTLGTIYRDHLRKINARELAETRESRAIERYQWFLFPGLCLLLAAGTLSRGRLAYGTPQRQATHAAAPAPLKNMTPT
ncbi:MAG: VWA domain-containing protein, partial [Verrucomicrobia bacterium]|nr:VWA domain-containing protein [Verrucomicrobiota bacterium]